MQDQKFATLILVIKVLLQELEPETGALSRNLSIIGSGLEISKQSSVGHFLPFAIGLPHIAEHPFKLFCKRGPVAERGHQHRRPQIGSHLS